MDDDGGKSGADSLGAYGSGAAASQLRAVAHELADAARIQTLAHELNPSVPQTEKEIR